MKKVVERSTKSANENERGKSGERRFRRFSINLRPGFWKLIAVAPYTRQEGVKKAGRSGKSQGSVETREMGIHIEPHSPRT